MTQSVRNQKVMTVEGIKGKDGGLHPVQKAMISELGPQCGFCTSGQIMSAVSLLESNAKPSCEEVRQGMAGNICRCGAYEHYTNAVMAAAKEA